MLLTVRPSFTVVDSAYIVAAMSDACRRHAAACLPDTPALDYFIFSHACFLHHLRCRSCLRYR